MVLTATSCGLKMEIRLARKNENAAICSVLWHSRSCDVVFVLSAGLERRLVDSFMAAPAAAYFRGRANAR